MYLAIAVTVSVFAAYGTALLLLLNVVLLLFLLLRKTNLSILFFIVLSSIFFYIYSVISLPVLLEEDETELSITWSEDVKIDGQSLKGFAKTSTGETVYAMYRFSSQEEKIQFLALDLPIWQFTVKGSFQPIAIPSHAYAFQMEKYLRMYGASGVFQVEKIIVANENRRFLSRLLLKRKHVKAHITKTFPEELIPEAEALLIGDRSGMSEEMSAMYRKLGITHLFAISGLHVGLLTWMIREVLLRLTVRRETVDVCLIFFLPLYAILAGGAPSVWRAVLVTVLILVMMYSRISIRVDHLLALSAIAFILMKPYIVFQPGFQLSYLAAFSLILSMKILSRTSSKIKLSFLVTMITQLALYPVLLLHFYELSLSSFIVNLVYVPLYAMIILPINLILLVLTAIAMPIAEILFFFYTPFRLFVHEMTMMISEIPFQLWVPGKPSVFGILVAVIGILAFFVMYECGKSLIVCLPCILLPALLIHIEPYTEGDLRVTYVDVGQGDSIVIELPFRRAVYVIDTGGTVPFGETDWKTPERKFEVGRQIVVPYLKGRGITKVDTLIISHPHLDHMGSAHELVEEVRVKEIHISPNSAVADEMEKLVRIAKEQKIPIVEKKDGDGWQEKDVGFYYVGPQSDQYVGNDSSLALYMKTKSVSFLFTGDMEEAAENEFLSKYRDADFGEVILKAGHHGSKTSSTAPFIEKLQPILAIIPAGRNNRYNHPHQEVLETFETYGVPALVTAEHGSITVHVQKDGWTVSTAK